MRDGRLNRLLEELEASFDGAEGHAEDLAAADLAASLLQDADTYDRLRAWRGAVLGDGSGLPITEVGDDYLACGDPPSRFVARGHAVIWDPERDDRGTPPRRVRRSLCLALRPWSRAKSQVTVAIEGGAVTGCLEAAARDHLVVSTGSRKALIPLSVVRAVSLYRGG